MSTEIDNAIQAVEESTVSLESLERITDQRTIWGKIVGAIKTNKSPVGGKMRGLRLEWSRKSGNQTFPEYAAQQAQIYENELQAGIHTIDKNVNLPGKLVSRKFGSLANPNANLLFRALFGLVPKTNEMLTTFSRQHDLKQSTDSIVDSLLS